MSDKWSKSNAKVMKSKCNKTVIRQRPRNDEQTNGRTANNENRLLFDLVTILLLYLWAGTCAQCVQCAHLNQFRNGKVDRDQLLRYAFGIGIDEHNHIARCWWWRWCLLHRWTNFRFFLFFPQIKLSREECFHFSRLWIICNGNESS